MSDEAVVYIHGKGGNVQEAEHYKALFPDCEIIGFDYVSQTPWEAKTEFRLFFEAVRKKYSRLTLIANSIGAYFAMCAGIAEKTDRAFFISPIADMESLICDMMLWAGVTEGELREKGTIETAFGETLSWKYLEWVRNNPVVWDAPALILYGQRDNLQSLDTIQTFACRTGAKLTVMENGEHWFHTEEQLRFVDDWIKGK